MSDKKISNKQTSVWSLFRGSSLFSPEHNAYYNFVVDCIISLGPDSEAEKHEGLHRIFSSYEGFKLLRGLAGISHVLLHFLFDTAYREGVHLVGRTLEELRVANPCSEESCISITVKHIKYVEELFDRCFRSLMPIAELQAIDFGVKAGDLDIGLLTTTNRLNEC